MATEAVPRDAYLKLINAFPLLPISSECELDRAVRVADSLIDRDDLTSDEEGYLEVLSRLIEDYERENDPLPALSGIEALRCLLEENGISQAQLSAETGIAVATISEILNGKKVIGPKVRQALAARFKVSPALFV